MSPGKKLPPVGSAVAGVCVPPPRPSVLPDVQQSLQADVGSQAFSLETYETFSRRDEQCFFDWGIGILEDAGVVGVRKNDYLCLSWTLRGEIDTGVGKPYSLALTRSSVGFGFGEPKSNSIQFADVMFETGGEAIEAKQIGDAFDCIRRQSAFLRAWKDCTSMMSTPSTIFKDLRILFDGSEIEMEVETDLGEFTVSVRRSTDWDVFQYSLTDAQLPIAYSARVADALLCDAAEDAGGVPDPSEVVCAMIGAAEMARSDPEWLAPGVRRRIRRT